MLLFNRKAYTLSQFILLWILGVLFVILVFLTVLRYRATSQALEAEAFMQQVRAEQEDRCALGRKYAVYSNHLKVFYKRKETAKFLRYDLSSGEGITAHHKLFDYHLRMPSYADGRICCDDCGKLNHYYSPCAVLEKMKDFIHPEADCTVYSVKKKDRKGARAGVTETQAVVESAEQQPAENRMTSNEEIAADAVAQTVPQTQTQQQPVKTPPEDSESTVQTDLQLLAQEPLPDAVQSQTEVVTQTVTEADDTPKKSTVKKCRMPQTGDFFIDDCEIYQDGVRGSVVHTWNEEKCAYEVTQSCVAPAKWKRSMETKEEKGLYPSDLDDYCLQLLKSSSCPQGAMAGRECAPVDAVCYKDCRISQQTEVKETDLIVLYDVQVSVEQLRCMPPKEVMVVIP